MALAPEVTELPLQNIRFLFGTMVDLRMVPTKLKHTGNVAIGEFKLVAHFPSEEKSAGNESGYLSRHKGFRGGDYAVYHGDPYSLDEIIWDATGRAGVHLITKTKYGQTVEFPTIPNKGDPTELNIIVSEYVESIKTPPLIVRCSGFGGILSPLGNKNYTLSLTGGQTRCPSGIKDHVPTKYHAEGWVDDGGRYVLNAEDYHRLSADYAIKISDAHGNPMKGIIRELDQDTDRPNRSDFRFRSEEYAAEMAHMCAECEEYFNACGCEAPLPEVFEAESPYNEYDWEGKPYTGQIWGDDVDLDESLADRNKDGKLSSWERAIGNQVARGTRMHRSGKAWDEVPEDERIFHRGRYYDRGQILPPGFFGAEYFEAASTAAPNLNREKANVEATVRHEIDGGFQWKQCVWGPHALRFEAHNSNKFYLVWVYDNGNGIFRALGAYGGLGQNPRLMDIITTRDQNQAIKAAAAKMKAKERKGYFVYSAEAASMEFEASAPTSSVSVPRKRTTHVCACGALCNCGCGCAESGVCNCGPSCPCSCGCGMKSAESFSAEHSLDDEIAAYLELVEDNGLLCDRCDNPNRPADWQWQQIDTLWEVTHGKDGTPNYSMQREEVNDGETENFCDKHYQAMYGSLELAACKDAESFEAPFVGPGALMDIGKGTDLSSFSPSELTHSSAIHGDFDTASLDYSGHQNIEVRGPHLSRAEGDTSGKWWDSSDSEGSTLMLIADRDTSISQLTYHYDMDWEGSIDGMDAQVDDEMPIKKGDILIFHHRSNDWFDPEAIMGYEGGDYYDMDMPTGSWVIESPWDFTLLDVIADPGNPLWDGDGEEPYIHHTPGGRSYEFSITGIGQGDDQAAAFQDFIRSSQIGDWRNYAIERMSAESFESPDFDPLNLDVNPEDVAPVITGGMKPGMIGGDMGGSQVAPIMHPTLPEEGNGEGGDQGGNGGNGEGEGGHGGDGGPPQDPQDPVNPSAAESFSADEMMIPRHTPEGTIMTPISEAYGAFYGADGRPIMLVSKESREDLTEEEWEEAKKKFEGQTNSTFKIGLPTFSSEYISNLSNAIVQFEDDGFSSASAPPNDVHFGADEWEEYGKGLDMMDEFDAMAVYNPEDVNDVHATKSILRSRYPGVKIKRHEYITLREGSANKFHVFIWTDRGVFNGHGRIGYNPTLFGPMSSADADIKFRRKLRKGYREHN